jgi:molybdate transport system substrate-binding protein
VKHLIPLIATVALGLTSCGKTSTSQSPGSPRTLTVFAAASLTQALEQVGHDFEAENPGAHIAFSFAGSQALRTQIEQGAPADVFASASPADMNALVSSRQVDSSATRPLVTNQLEVILPATNPAGLSRLQDLARPGLKLVLAAPDVPVGMYARQSLRLMDTEFGPGFSGKVLSNVVSQEDNVKQVVAKVQLGEADAGIVYISDAVAAPDVKRITIPAGLNVTAQYVIAPLSTAPEAGFAAAFVEYVRSPAAESVFIKWGFHPIP